MLQRPLSYPRAIVIIIAVIISILALVACSSSSDSEKPPDGLALVWEAWEEINLSYAGANSLDANLVVSGAMRRVLDLVDVAPYPFLTEIGRMRGQPPSHVPGELVDLWRAVAMHKAANPDFDPSTIALIGASNRPGSVGAVLARNLFGAGFEGPILTVNPRERAIRSTLNYRSIAELPLVPDLAVISTPPDTVPDLIGELGARGCRAAVVITAGFGEGDRAEGQDLRQAMLDAARPQDINLLNQVV